MTDPRSTRHRPARRAAGRIATLGAIWLALAALPAGATRLELVGAERSLSSSGTSISGSGGASSSDHTSSEALGHFDRRVSSIGGSASQTSSIGVDGITAAGTTRAGRASISEARNRLTAVFRVAETSFWQVRGDLVSGNGFTNLRIRLDSEPFYGGQSIWRASCCGQTIAIDEIVRLEAGTLYALDFEQYEEPFSASFDWSFANTPIPEPGTTLLIGLGLVPLARIRRVGAPRPETTERPPGHRPDERSKDSRRSEFRSRRAHRTTTLSRT